MAVRLNPTGFPGNVELYHGIFDECNVYVMHIWNPAHTDFCEKEFEYPHYVQEPEIMAQLLRESHSAKF